MRKLFSLHNLALEAVLGVVPTLVLLFLCGGDYAEFTSKLDQSMPAHPFQYWFVLVGIIGLAITLLNIRVRFSKALVSLCLDVVAAFTGVLQALNGIVLFVMLFGILHLVFDIRLLLLIAFYLISHMIAVYLSKFVDSEKIQNAKMI